MPPESPKTFWFSKIRQEHEAIGTCQSMGKHPCRRDLDLSFLAERVEDSWQFQNAFSLIEDGARLLSSIVPISCGFRRGFGQMPRTCRWIDFHADPHNLYACEFLDPNHENGSSKDLAGAAAAQLWSNMLELTSCGLVRVSASVGSAWPPGRRLGQDTYC